MRQSRAAGDTRPRDFRAEMGDSDAQRQGADEILRTALYVELRRLARSRLRSAGPAASLSPTELVHEAYLRLGGGERRLWDDAGHFFAAAAESMRRILIDRARARMRAKRGGGRPLAALDENAVACEDRPEELLALHEALAELEREDERAARIVKLRYFAGMSVEETAEAVAVTPRTVMRDWAAARAWLAVRMAKRPPRSATP